MFCELAIDPVAKGRPRFTRTGRAYTPAKTKAHESHLKRLLIEAYGLGEPMAGPVAVTILFGLKRPKGVSAKKRPYPAVKPDLDNLAKAVLDALNEVVIADDNQVVKLTLEKCYQEYGAVGIEVYELHE